VVEKKDGHVFTHSEISLKSLEFRSPDPRHKYGILPREDIDFVPRIVWSSQ
jgi:hypothetical protein